MGAERDEGVEMGGCVFWVQSTQEVAGLALVFVEKWKRGRSYSALSN